MVHDGTKRSFLVPFFDESARLCTLFDHPNVVGVLSSLLGDDFNYVGGGGNYYSGDTNWHDDGGHRVGGLVFVKFHIYLDPLTRETGCIRMIPGSHLEGEWRDQLQKVRLQAFSEELGIGGNDVACVAAETKPRRCRRLESHNVPRLLRRRTSTPPSRPQRVRSGGKPTRSSRILINSSKSLRVSSSKRKLRMRKT